MNLLFDRRARGGSVLDDRARPERSRAPRLAAAALTLFALCAISCVAPREEVDTKTTAPLPAATSAEASVAPSSGAADESVRSEAAARPVGASFEVTTDETARDETAPGESDARPAGGRSRRVEREGIAVEYSMTPVDAEGDGPHPLTAGHNVTVRFTITDTTTGSPATTLSPAAWLHPVAARPDPSETCAQKVAAFLSGGLAARAEIDLNVYYVLALNDDATISVVDPLFSFGGSKLLDMVELKSPGEDWVLSPDESRLYVTMPAAREVAVVDTASWRVLANIAAGRNPRRIRLQPDGKYLWVGSDGSSALDPTTGITVIDAAKMERLTLIPTGQGHHEVAFSDDSLYAFVTNDFDATVSILDIRELKNLRNLHVGRHPVSVAFSPLSRAAYVVSEEEGTITVINAESLEVVETITAQPGLGMLRFAPGGRLGFVVNTRENVVHIIDASTQRIIQSADVGEAPDQVTFTDNMAYVRSRGSELILMIPLDEVGHEGRPVPIIDFTGGNAPFDRAKLLSIADAIYPAPGGTSVLVANPFDKAIYYYREGMAAPMGHFKNYGREPRAVIVVDRSLREVEPGVYSTDVKLSESGEYDLAFFLDAPRIVHCFTVDVEPDPELPPVDQRLPIRVEPLEEQRIFPPGEDIRLRFKVTDPRNDDRPWVDLKDFGVVAFASTSWKSRQWAQPVGEGIYEVAVKLPANGIYYVFFQCPSLNVTYKSLPHIVLRASKEG